MRLAFALLALWLVLFAWGCSNSQMPDLDTRLNCYAVAVSTEDDLINRLVVRDELDALSTTTMEQSRENDALRKIEQRQLAAVLEIKERFSGVWAKAALKAPDAANARLKDAGRQYEDIRLQTLNRNCGEVPTK